MHLVVLDLEAADAGALAFAGFHVDQIGAAVIVERAVFVEVGIKTRGDDATVADLGGRFAADGTDQQIERGVRCVEIAEQLPNQGRNRAGQRGAQAIEAGQRFAQAGQVAWPGVAQGDAAGNALDVGDAAQAATDFTGDAAIVIEQEFDGAVAGSGKMAFAQRVMQRMTEQARTHAGHAVVEQREQRRRGLAAQGFG